MQRCFFPANVLFLVPKTSCLAAQSWKKKTRKAIHQVSGSSTCKMGSAIAASGGASRASGGRESGATRAASFISAPCSRPRFTRRLQAHCSRGTGVCAFASACCLSRLTLGLRVRSDGASAACCLSRCCCSSRPFSLLLLLLLLL